MQKDCLQVSKYPLVIVKGKLEENELDCDSSKHSSANIVVNTSDGNINDKSHPAGGGLVDNVNILPAGDSLGVYNTCVPPAEASHSVSKVNSAPAAVSLDISDPNKSSAADGPGVCHTTEPPAVVCTVAATPTNYVIGSYVLA